MMTTRSGTAVAAVLLAVVLSPAPAAAQGDFPTRPIRLLVGFPPGGSTDVLARTLAQESRKAFGQDVIVINKPGASGALAALDVVASPADGYTIGISPSSTFTLAYHFQNIRPDLLENTSALTVAGRQRIGIAIKSDSPIRTLPDLIEAARKEPGKVSVGIPGTGTMVELISRAVFQQAKVDVNIVPFQGDAPIVTAILGGHVTAGSFAAGGWAPQVRAGSLRLLASMEEERAEAAPDVPTVMELGYPLKGASIQYLYAPKGLPAALRKRLIDVLLEASRSPNYVDIASKNALYDANATTGDALDQYLLKDRAGIAELVTSLGLKKN
jgi:tripartite-type tricarboxylate transporter receptor subunit TctC